MAKNVGNKNTKKKKMGLKVKSRLFLAFIFFGSIISILSYKFFYNVKSINEMYNRNCIDKTLNTVADFFYFTNDIKPTAKVIITTVLARLEC